MLLARCYYCSFSGVIAIAPLWVYLLRIRERGAQDLAHSGFIR